MTGKEALKLAQDIILAHNGNNKSSFTMKMLYQVEAELNEKDEKLTKYKRAFEILKDFDLFTIRKQEEPELYCIDTYNNEQSLTKEEYELLEELMKYESR